MDQGSHSDGFTLVEAMVGMLLAVVALFGTLSLLDGTNRITGDTMASEGATALARDVIERAHRLSYPALAPSAVAAALQATYTDETTTTTSTGWTMSRRGTTYTVAISSCKLDDDADGYGSEDSRFCVVGTTANPATGSVGSTVPTSTVQIAGVPITIGAGGTLLAAVCSAIGTNTTLAGLLSPTSSGLATLVGRTADVSLCSSTGTTKVVLDQDPDDYTRIAVLVSWTTGTKTRSIGQVALIANPGTPNA